MSRQQALTREGGRWVWPGSSAQRRGEERLFPGTHFVEPLTRGSVNQKTCVSLSTRLDDQKSGSDRVAAATRQGELRCE
jgi:hypothetical protein